MPPVAIVGNLSLDHVEGGPPRAGGAPFHAARALRVLGRPALVLVKCAPGDRHLLLPPLAALGVPVAWIAGASTAEFSFRYDGDHRLMTVDALGDSWSAEDVAGVGGARFVHVGPLARSDFPATTLAELAQGRTVSYDGQGLVRPDRTGPLRLDGDFDPEMLRHVQILKLAEEEAEMVGAVDKLGVPEVLVTYGERGSTVFADGRQEHVEAWPIAGDPTGSGDAFSAAYLAGRSHGLGPFSAARKATAVVGAMLTRRAR